MQSDFEIGRIVAVDTAEVTIELNRELKALTLSTYEGAREIGKINSYVIIPVGARRLVAIVTKVVLVEEAELKADRTMVTLPSTDEGNSDWHYRWKKLYSRCRYFPCS